jgi:hypothetical protein
LPDRAEDREYREQIYTESVIFVELGGAVELALLRCPERKGDGTGPEEKTERFENLQRLWDIVCLDEKIDIGGRSDVAVEDDSDASTDGMRYPGFVECVEYIAELFEDIEGHGNALWAEESAAS